GSVPPPPGPRLGPDQLTAAPGWTGSGGGRAWWPWDGAHACCLRKRDGSDIRATYPQAVGSAPAQAARLDGAALAGIDGARQVVDPTRARMAFVRNGDIFVRDLSSGALTQLTRTDAAESRPQWGSDGALVWRAGNDWFRWTAANGT